MTTQRIEAGMKVRVRAQYLTEVRAWAAAFHDARILGTDVYDGWLYLLEWNEPFPVAGVTERDGVQRLVGLVVPDGLADAVAWIPAAYVEAVVEPQECEPCATT